MKVLFIFPYPHGTAASQRFRFEQYLGFLQQEGIQYKLASFLDEATWKILYKPGHLLRKITGILKGFGRRWLLLWTVPQYDFVFIHREAAPIGPPVLEWIIARVFRKKLIFDFDDAIWLPNTSEQNRIAAGLKWHHKTASICKWAHIVSAGNAYLAAYAHQFTTHVVINPTTIDTVHLHNRVKDQAKISEEKKIVIGWTGTHSTIPYLNELLPIIEKLERLYSFTFLVISDREPTFTLRSLRYQPWQKETEIDDLLQFNIGVMPLTDDRWAQGKCGFKALQYMALGIPALVSPVGVNTAIVTDQVNGFVCSTAAEWEKALHQVLTDVDLRTKLGKAAREKVEFAYSVTANRRTFLRFFTA